jgi:hypothetical protein
VRGGARRGKSHGAWKIQRRSADLPRKACQAGQAWKIRPVLSDFPRSVVEAGRGSTRTAEPRKSACTLASGLLICKHKH